MIIFFQAIKFSQRLSALDPTKGLELRLIADDPGGPFEMSSLSYHLRVLTLGEATGQILRQMDSFALDSSAWKNPAEMGENIVLDSGIDVVQALDGSAGFSWSVAQDGQALASSTEQDTILGVVDVLPPNQLEADVRLEVHVEIEFNLEWGFDNDFYVFLSQIETVPAVMFGGDYWQWLLAMFHDNTNGQCFLAVDDSEPTTRIERHVCNETGTAQGMVNAANIIYRVGGGVQEEIEVRVLSAICNEAGDYACPGNFLDTVHQFVNQTKALNPRAGLQLRIGLQDGSTVKISKLRVSLLTP